MPKEPANRRAGAAIAAVAASRHGVVTVAQLTEAGLLPSGITDRVAAGRLFRLHRGVYSIVPPSLLKAKGRWLAAVLACTRGAVLSHTAAAALWGMGRIPRRARPRKRPERLRPPWAHWHRHPPLEHPPTQTYHQSQRYPGHRSRPHPRDLGERSVAIDQPCGKPRFSVSTPAPSRSPRPTPTELSSSVASSRCVAATRCGGHAPDGSSAPTRLTSCRPAAALSSWRLMGTAPTETAPPSRTTVRGMRS